MADATAPERFPRWLEWASSGDDLEDVRLASLERFMLLAMVLHAAMLLDRPDAIGEAARRLLFPAFVASALIGLAKPALRPYCIALSWCVASLWIGVSFPVSENHLFLEWSVLLFLVVSRGDPALALQAVRFLVLIVFFYSGLQKAWGGQYFGAEFLSSKIATSANFRAFFGLLIDPAEFERLIRLGGAMGSGPYTSRDPLMIAMSNAVWIGETLLPFFLLWRRTRTVALVATLGLVLGIELGAREVVFGALFTALLLLFQPARNALALWPALTALQAIAVVGALGFPAMGFN